MSLDAHVIETKVVLLGESGVGKTSIVLQYVHKQFSSNLNPTIGASFLTKTLWVDGFKLKLQLWDTAGQERFRSLAPMYYRGASIALLVYDVTAEESFVRAQEWVKELKANVFEDIILVVVGNKIDYPDRAVSYERAAEYAQSIGGLCFDTSAKNNAGIEDMFLALSRRLIQIARPPEPDKQVATIKPSQNQPKKSDSNCC